MDQNSTGVQPAYLTNSELAHYAWLQGPENLTKEFIAELIKRFTALLDDDK